MIKRYNFAWIRPYSIDVILFYSFTKNITLSLKNNINLLSALIHRSFYFGQAMLWPKYLNH